jgi:hypothetical protein
MPQTVERGLVARDRLQLERLTQGMQDLVLQIRCESIDAWTHIN